MEEELEGVERAMARLSHRRRQLLHRREALLQVRHMPKHGLQCLSKYAGLSVKGSRPTTWFRKSSQKKLAFIWTILGWVGCGIQTQFISFEVLFVLALHIRKVNSHVSKIGKGGHFCKMSQIKLLNF